MNILFIAHDNSMQGGASKSLIVLIDELIRKDVNIYVLIPNQPGEFTEKLKQRNIMYFPFFSCMWMQPKKFNFFERETNWLTDHLVAYNILAKIKSLKIDLIHSNSSVVNIGGILSKLTGIPHLWHIREFGKEDYNLEYSYGKNFTLNFIRRHSRKIIVISESLKQKYQPFFGEKTILIYNGIACDYLNYHKKKNTNQFSILLAGSIFPGKGQVEAILAVKELVELGYTNLCLYIAGNPIDSNYFLCLEKIVTENNLQKYVQFIGFIKDLREIRSMMNMELVCSTKEAFGRVTIEAMMSMNPVIGADCGATPELIRSGFNGLLYHNGDYKDLAEKIKILINDPQKSIQMGENAFNFAKENFTASKNAELIYKLYKDIIFDKTL